MGNSAEMKYGSIERIAEKRLSLAEQYHALRATVEIRKEELDKMNTKKELNQRVASAKTEWTEDVLNAKRNLNCAIATTKSTKDLIDQKNRIIAETLKLMQH